MVFQAASRLEAVTEIGTPIHGPVYTASDPDGSRRAVTFYYMGKPSCRQGPLPKARSRTAIFLLETTGGRFSIPTPLNEKRVAGRRPARFFRRSFLATLGPSNCPVPAMIRRPRLARDPQFSGARRWHHPVLFGPFRLDPIRPSAQSERPACRSVANAPRNSKIMTARAENSNGHPYWRRVRHGAATSTRWCRPASYRRS